MYVQYTRDRECTHDGKVRRDEPVYHEDDTAMKDPVDISIMCVVCMVPQISRASTVVSYSCSTIDFAHRCCVCVIDTKHLLYHDNKERLPPKGHSKKQTNKNVTKGSTPPCKYPIDKPTGTYVSPAHRGNIVLKLLRVVLLHLLQ